MNNKEKEYNIAVFRPKYSKWAYLSLLGIIIFIGWLQYVMFTFFNQIGIIPFIITSILLCSILLYSIFLLCIYHTMRYELRNDGLYLICGPVHSKIDYKTIETIEKTDLPLDIISSTRLPGYALFNVPYGNRGTIRMYSTSALKNILLIKTNDGKQYGITPKDEEEFLKELKLRIDAKE